MLLVSILQGREGHGPHVGVYSCPGVRKSALSPLLTVDEAWGYTPVSAGRGSGFLLL